MNRRLKNSWKAHGALAFKFSVLELCSVDRINEREEFWITYYRQLYPGLVTNSEGPCDNPMRGSKHRPETIAKLSAASSAMVRTEAHRRKIGNAHRGKVLSESTKQKLRIKATGRKNPLISGDLNPSKREEHRARFRGELNPIHRPGVKELISAANSKEIIDVKSSQTWKSMSECAKYLGVSVAAVSSAIKNGFQCKHRTLQTINNLKDHNHAI